MADKVSVLITGNNKPLIAALKEASNRTRASTTLMTQNFRKLNQSTVAAANSFNLLRVAAVAYASVNVAKGVIELTDDYIKLNAQIKFNTKSLDEYNFAKSELIRISNVAQLRTSDLTSVYSRFNQSLKTTGISQQKLSKLTETVALSMKVMGTRAGEAGGAMIQMAQSFGLGWMQAQEFNSVAEASPILMDQLAKSMRKPRGSLKELAGQLKITKEEMLKAWTDPVFLASMRKQALAMRTLSGSFIELRNAATIYIGEIDTANGTTRSLAGIVRLIAGNIKDMGEVVTATAGVFRAFGDTVWNAMSLASKAIQNAFGIESQNQIVTFKTVLDDIEFTMINLSTAIMMGGAAVKGFLSVLSIGTTAIVQAFNSLDIFTPIIKALFRFQKLFLSTVSNMVTFINSAFVFDADGMAKALNESLANAKDTATKTALDIDKVFSQLGDLSFKGMSDSFDKTMSDMEKSIDNTFNNIGDIAAKGSKKAMDVYKVAPAPKTVVLPETTGTTKKVAKEASAAELKEQSIEIDQRRRTEILKLESKREALRLGVALGKLSTVEALKEELKISQQEIKINRDTIKEKIALYGDDLKAKKRLTADLEALNIQSANQQVKLNNDIIIAQAAAQKKLIEDQRKSITAMLAPIRSAMESATNSMIQGTMTFRDAMLSILDSIAAKFVNIAFDMAQNWIVAEAMKTNATASGTAARGAIEAGAAAKSIVLAIGTGIKNVMISAWEAFAGAYAAIAAIPVVGPVLAPVAAGAAFAGVAAVASNIASARGGYDIPAGVNPITQLHEKEMVLPAKHAESIRNMTGGGGNTINIHTMDVRGVKDWFTKNPDALTGGLNKLNRNFAGV